MSNKRARQARQTARQPVRQARKPVSSTPVWVGPAAVAALVAVVVAAFLIYRWYTTPLPAKTPAANETQQVIATITGLPASEFDSIGQGTANNLLKPISGSPLTGASGKPEVFYLGGEFCPYCGAQRWAMIIALSRFGTFSGLKTMASSADIEFPNTPTFTFHGATYTSQYIDFRGLETTDRDQNPLDTPTAAEDQLFTKYNSEGTIPFVDVGNRYAFTGAMYSPEALAGQSWQAVADEVKDPTSVQAKAIVGSANLLTAAICKITSDQPASVCSSATIQGLEQKLG
jgi:hypothetical protein